MENTSDNNLTSFANMLRRSLGDLLASDTPDFVAMMAEDGVMEFPYAPDGAVRSLTGRRDLKAYLEALNGVIELGSFDASRVHHTTDPNIVIIEFTAQGRSRGQDERYEQTYISVVTVRDGHIQHYRDYWNPLVVLKAMGGSETPAVGQQPEAK